MTAAVLSYTVYRMLITQPYSSALVDNGAAEAVVSSGAGVVYITKIRGGFDGEPAAAARVTVEVDGVVDNGFPLTTGGAFFVDDGICVYEALTTGVSVILAASGIGGVSGEITVMANVRPSGDAGFSELTAGV